MNLLTSTIETLERRNLTSVLFNLFLISYVLFILACVISFRPADFSSIIAAPIPELSAYTVLGVDWITTVIASVVILQMLWDLGKGRFLCSANVRRFRILALLAGVDVFLNIYLSMNMERASISPMFEHVRWQWEIYGSVSIFKGPLNAMLLFCVWQTLSVILSDAIRIEAENREAI